MNTVNPRIAMAAGRPVAHTPLPTRAQLLRGADTLDAALFVPVDEDNHRTLASCHVPRFISVVRWKFLLTV
jgi:hypothetical protein